VAERKIRWLDHARKNLRDREIEESEVIETIETPEFQEAGREGRRILMRNYSDKILGQMMLLRVVIEEHPGEMVIVTFYKTSRGERYTKDLE
jgi:hypothetical protein